MKFRVEKEVRVHRIYELEAESAFDAEEQVDLGEVESVSETDIEEIDSVVTILEG